MHTALLHDQTINEILGYKDIWKCTPEIADRDTIPDGENNTANTRSSASVHLSCYWNLRSLATRFQSGRPGWATRAWG
jgi:hypothetical protein